MFKANRQLQEETHYLMLFSDITEVQFLRLTAKHIKMLSEESTEDLLFLTKCVTHRMLLHGYGCGIFPMPYLDPAAEQVTLYCWFSPVKRAIIQIPPSKDSALGNPPKSLRASAKRYHVTINSDFRSTVNLCAETRSEGNWINSTMTEMYNQLHLEGHAHSIETWRSNIVRPELVGGLFGVQSNKIFAGESMFHRANDASKVALLELVRVAPSLGIELIDAQWITPHLASLGAVEIPRMDYLSIIDNTLLMSTE